MVLQFIRGRTYFCMGLIYRKLCRFLLMFSTGFTSLSVLLLFPSLFFCKIFDSILSNIDEFLSINPAQFLSLETLTSIIWTGLPILVGLIDLVNSVIIFLSQMTLLLWLTFLLGSQTVILIVLFCWSYFFLLILAFVLQWLCLH